MAANDVWANSWGASWGDAWQTAAGMAYQTGDAQAFALTDLDAFFADAALSDIAFGFAESVYSGTTAMAGIFDDHSVSGGDRDGPKVMLKTSDVSANSIDQGSVLFIRDRTFHVAGVQRDGVGVSTVILVEPS